MSPISFHDPNPKDARSIPGGYGPPFLGAIKDRLDYFYNQGETEFFRARVKKYDSTVFRANMPPGPFMAHDSRVIILLDAKSFPVLFDVSKVEKKNIFTGTYMPSVKFTGGYRVCSYLDPSEPNHEKVKSLLFYLLKSTHDRVIPEFHNSFSAMFDSFESDLASHKTPAFTDPSTTASFNFLIRAWYQADPSKADTKLLKAPKIILVWILLQLAPITSFGLPRVLEELTFHSHKLPSLIIKRDYKKLYKFFNEISGPFLDEGERLGLSREEACHNLLFATCFNTFGGMFVVFPSIINLIGTAGKEVHARLAKEIRSVVNSFHGRVTLAALENMPLMKSAVYEVLRNEPPVKYQYGKAKKDLVIESHDSVFKVKKGEVLFGFQPFATKDPVVFERPEEYVVDRFVGEGEKLLKYLLWSNGPETESPTVNNKQCAGKDFVVLMSRLLVVELFLRYDTFEIEPADANSTTGPKITKLVKATY